jgi:hypothetical protein
MALKINTTDYVNTHGREPRGRGTWAFAPAVSGARQKGEPR